MQVADRMIELGDELNQQYGWQIELLIDSLSGSASEVFSQVARK